MTDFASEIRQRAAAARRALDEARAGGDDYLAQILQGELDTLGRLAEDHHVVLDLTDSVAGVTESAGGDPHRS